MRYTPVPLIALMTLLGGCGSDPTGSTAAPAASLGIGGSPTALTLHDESGVPLVGQTGDSRYRCGGSWAAWAPFTTDAAGQFTVVPDCAAFSGNWDSKVAVRLNQNSREQEVTLNPVFTAARVNVNLASCTGPITGSPGGTVAQGGGHWVTHGTTGPSGTVSFYTFPGNVKLQMTYNHLSVTRDVVPVTEGSNEVDYVTTNVTLLHDGAIRSPTGGWWTFEKPSMELLPGLYQFQFHDGTSWGSNVPLEVSGCDFVYPAPEDTDDEPPVVANVAVTPNPAPYTTASFALTADATDNVEVTTASYTINGNSPVAFSFTSGANAALSATLDPLDVGVYEVCVTAADEAGNASEAECTMLAVYDPAAGFVTGGGWINSPTGAYMSDETLTGKASFGFVSKYVKGKDVPTGNTEFQFKAGNLNFSSSSYDWLVVSGARAQFRGAGTINGAGDFRFMLTAIDGQVSGGGGLDKFRIRIWDNAAGGVVYDNLLNAPDSADPTTVLGGGSIVIHVPKK